MKKIRVGVVGYGGISQGVHVPGYLACPDNAEITAVCDINPEKLLKTKPFSSISVGYDLVNMMQKTEKPLKNRLFEIYKSQSPVLPKITLTEKGYYFE